MARRTASEKKRKTTAIPAIITRITRSHRAASIQPLVPFSSLCDLAKPVAQAAGVPPTDHLSLTHHFASDPPVEFGTLVLDPIKPARKISDARCIPPPPRSGYGDAHAYNEHRRMLEFAEAARKIGTIEEETLAHMCRLWQDKGILEMRWKREYLINDAKGEEVMDLKKAEGIAKRKDAKERRFIQDYREGKIDENGNRINDPTKEIHTQSNVSRDVAPGRASKRRPLKSMKVPLDPIEEEKPAITFRIQTATPGIASIAPLPGLPDYNSYTYYQLAALCFERNLVSGGSAVDIRNRLVQDDINVVRNLPREAKSYSKEKDRGRKNMAPVVPNAPHASPAVYGGRRKKRTRNEGEDQESTGAKRMKVD